MVLKNIIKSIIAHTGYEVRRKRPPAPIYNRGTAPRFFEHCWKSGRRPSLVLDVGANRGRWTRALLRNMPGTKIWMVEPQEFLKDKSLDLIEAGKVEWLTAGAARESGSLTLTLTDRDDTSNFRQTREEARERGFEQQEVPVFSLNDLIDKIGRIPEWVKIDAEGMDLEVLEGASDLLGKTDLFFVESSVVDVGIENTFARVHAFMKSHGYRLLDFTDLNYSKSGELILVESVFERASKRKEEDSHIAES